MNLRDWDRACEQTAEAHGAILRELHQLEDVILVSGVPPPEWVGQVRRALIGLIELLEHHRKAVAPPDGLIGLVDLQGHSRRVTDLGGTHDRVVDDAQSLLQSLSSTTTPEASYSPFRRDAARLGSAVRKQEAEEVALIYETNVRVSGGEG